MHGYFNPPPSQFRLKNPLASHNVDYNKYLCQLQVKKVPFQRLSYLVALADGADWFSDNTACRRAPQGFPPIKKGQESIFGKLLAKTNDILGPLCMLLIIDIIGSKTCILPFCGAICSFWITIALPKPKSRSLKT